MARISQLATRLLCVLALNAGHWVHAQNSGDEAHAALFRWAEAKGAQIGVELGYNKDGIRGIFATRDFSALETIVSVPTNLLFITATKRDSWDDSVLTYIREYHNPGSRFRIYLDAQPKAHEVAGVCTLPVAYFQMLQSAYLENIAHDTRRNLLNLLNPTEGYEEHWYSVADDVTDKDLTFKDLQHACQMVSSHTIDGNPRPVTIMAPIFDLCNFHRGCKHYVESNYTRGGYFRLMAGSDVKKGDEICYHYGDMEDDHALMTYGFLPPIADPPMLLEVDAHYHQDVDTEYKEDGEYVPGHEIVFKAKDRVALINELTRLTGILHGLEKLDRTTTNPPPIPGQEYLHSLLLEMQRRRRVALRREIHRLTVLGKPVQDL